MTTKRKIEIFSAGCPACQETIALVNQIACSSCEISVLDIKDPATAKRATDLGVKSVPAVAVNGQLATCCQKGGPNAADLKEAGVGQPL